MKCLKWLLGIVLIVLIIILYKQKIHLSLPKNNVILSVNMLNTEKSLYLTKGNDVGNIIDIINSFWYFPTNEVLGSSSPDIWVCIYDRSSNELLADLYFYGCLAKHKNKTYIVSPFVIYRFENICEKYGE